MTSESLGNAGGGRCSRQSKKKLLGVAAVCFLLGLGCAPAWKFIDDELFWTLTVTHLDGCGPDTVVSIGSEVYKSPYAYAAVAARKFPVHVTIAGKDYIGLVEIRGEAYWHLDCSKKMLANYPLIPAPPPEQIPEAP